MKPATTAQGFTLVELLVVLAVIGILASLLLPALVSAGAKGQAAACLNAQKQITFACLLYADDANDRLPYNLGEAQIKQLALSGQFPNWTSPVMSWELDPDNTNSTLVARAGLGPYTSQRSVLYRCPSDRVVSDIQAAAGWTERVRSVSMNAMVGDAGSFSQGGSNVNNPEYRQFFKLAQIPQPSRIFVLIEEHPDSINDGYFLNHLDSRRWTDLPASHHRSAGNLTFADGHLETHRWLDRLTCPPARPDTAHLPMKVPPGNRDYAWLMEHTTVEASPDYNERPSQYP